MSAFRIGLNYWPADTAMGWWPAFDRERVTTDFARIAAAGFDSVRLFLTWEHFQPEPDRPSTAMLEHLVTTLELAHQAKLSVMPTLFTGHMSGVNFLPGWALGGEARDPRFRVVSANRVVPTGLLNWYTDAAVADAQSVLALELSRALAGHPALFAWDLGNENSNCVIPPTRASGRSWLGRISDALRAGDAAAKVTIGLHMEDLEEDRNLGPAEAAEVCDFLTMHGYPGYAKWARSPTDEQLLPFLAAVTRWLSGGAAVLFSEFGVPTHPAGEPATSPLLLEEQAAAAYVERSLDALHACGCTGAMLWCHADYARSLWQTPPLDLAVHERFFGLWRADTSAKPVLDAVARFGQRATSMETPDASFIDIEQSEFYQRPGFNLAHLYGRYTAGVSAR